MIRPATEADAPALTALINLAFQVERFFLDSDRLDLAEVLDRLRKGFFLIEEADSRMIACVYVELRGDRAYLGLLSVEPAIQRGGLGKRLVDAAEEFARASGSRHMDLNVVNLREELPPFYRKLGYSESGTSPFPSEVYTKLPCHFIQMSKPL
jgi:N-acetylglutamate synthase-like GNAT family acetyltransferase